MKKRKQGFTLIEVMIAVMILAFVATGTLQLVFHSQKSLDATKKKKELQKIALKVETEIKTGIKSEHGTEGDLKWEIEEKQGEFFGENFGKLNFADEGEEQEVQQKNIPWRKLTITYKGDTMVFALPAKGKGKNNNKQSDIISEDKKETDETNK